MKLVLALAIAVGSATAQAATVRFSGDVSRSSMNSLVAKVRALSQGGDRNITISIGDSDGGDLYAALAAMPELRRYNVNTHAVGECASACTALYAVGRARSSDGGRFMFHAAQVERTTRTGRRLSRAEQKAWVEKFANDWLRAIREASPALAGELDRKDTLTKGGDTWYSTKKARTLGYVNN